MFVCCRSDLDLVAETPSAIAYAGMGVLVTRDGEVTNRWADGTAGVPDEIREEVADVIYDVDPPLYCLGCGETPLWL